jgi:hypothetical protein
MSKLSARTGPPSSLASRDVARHLERLAWLMDRSLRIPGTRITLGLDALLGLLPGGGDLLTGIIQAGLVLVALHHYRVPKSVALRMAGNVLLDIAVGAIPVLGDLFDVAFKANTRNLRLLEPYRRAQEATAPASIPTTGRPLRSGTPLRYVVPVAVALLAALVLLVIGIITVVRWLVSLA